jgi:hypothetical protein
MNKKDLPVPAEYKQASQRFSIIWNDYVQREEDAKFEFINMVKILESNGYTRTKAISKIVSDHKHLKGFSRMTIYRSLPDDMKRKYESSNIIMLPDNSDVSNDTFENLQEIDAKDAIFLTNDDIYADEQLDDVKTLQERNRLLIKTLQKERYEAYETRITELKKRNEERLKQMNEELNIEIPDPDDTFALVFIREYQSKDKCILQEYECEPVYNGWILPHSITLNITEKKVVSAVLDHDKYELYNKVLINQNKTKK